MATARKSTKATATKVEFAVINVGHAFIKGKGPNDKPRKNSIWGVMAAGDAHVKFFGRVGGAIRFKRADSLDEAMKLYDQKLAGTDAKKLPHVDLSAAAQKELLGADWPESLYARYKDALKKGAVDVRKGDGKQESKPVVTAEVAAWPWPKSPA